VIVHIVQCTVWINVFSVLIDVYLLITVQYQVAVASICLFVILPLTLVGTVLGRNIAGQANYPCRVNAVQRVIPEKKW